jgi:hypothetical protein
MIGDHACTAYARAHEIDPIGTAGVYDAFVLVEASLPWPAEAAEHPRARAVADTMTSEDGRVRIQLVSPSDSTAVRSAVWYRRTCGQPFKGYVRHEEEQDIAGDVLICTHGRRDRCCGQLGTRLFMSADHHSDRRVRRTSHTGGHRFAPTAVVLPEGTSWAYLDALLLEGIVNRTTPVDVAAAHFRGCSGLEGPQVQAVDREGFVRHGWAWMDATRQGRVVDRSGGECMVRLEYELADGRSGRYEAVVVDRRTIPLPPCGQPLGPTPKMTVELSVRHLVERCS